MEIKQVAINFIKSLSNSEKEKLKIMLSHGISCGTDYAKRHEIEPYRFNEELKNIFEGK